MASERYIPEWAKPFCSCKPFTPPQKSPKSSSRRRWGTCCSWEEENIKERKTYWKWDPNTLYHLHPDLIFDKHGLQVDVRVKTDSESTFVDFSEECSESVRADGGEKDGLSEEPDGLFRPPLAFLASLNAECAQILLRDLEDIKCSSFTNSCSSLPPISEITEKPFLLERREKRRSQEMSVSPQFRLQMDSKNITVRPKTRGRRTLTSGPSSSFRFESTSKQKEKGEKDSADKKSRRYSSRTSLEKVRGSPGAKWASSLRSGGAGKKPYNRRRTDLIPQMKLDDTMSIKKRKASNCPKEH